MRFLRNDGKSSINGDKEIDKNFIENLQLSDDDTLVIILSDRFELF